MAKNTADSSVDKPACRMAPHIPLSRVESMVVYRISQLSTAKKPTPVKSQILGDWKPESDEEASIADAAGPGTYLVEYRDPMRRVVGSIEFTVESCSRSSGGRGNSEILDTASETPSGWVTHAGLTPKTNSILVMAQQRVQEAREDAYRSVQAMSGMFANITETLTKLATNIQPPQERNTESLSLLRHELKSMRESLERREVQIQELQAKGLALELKARTKDEPSILRDLIAPMLPKLLETAPHFFDGIRKEMAAEMVSLHAQQQAAQQQQMAQQQFVQQQQQAVVTVNPEPSAPVEPSNGAAMGLSPELAQILKPVN